MIVYFVQASVIGIDAETGYQDVAELLDMSVVMDSCGNKFISLAGCAGNVKPLASAICQHSVLKLPVQVGSTPGATTDMDVGRLARPMDCGMKAFWSLGAVYNYLGLVTCGNQPSKWVGKFQQRWGNEIAELFPGRHLMSSRQAQDTSTAVHTRMFPFPSVFQLL